MRNLGIASGQLAASGTLRTLAQPPCQEYTPFSLFTPVSYTRRLHPVTTPLPPYILSFTSCLQNTPFTYRLLMATLFSINTLLVVVGR